ncbi:unnamed protein product [Alternaria alternata]
MKSFTTLLTLAALFAIALGASLPLASDRHRGPLKPKPSNHLRSMVERLVANGTFPDDENTRLFSEYPCGDDDDDFDEGDNFQPDECTTAFTTSDIPSSTSFVDAKGDNDILPNTLVNDGTPDFIQATTCKKCSQVYKDCKNTATPPGNQF